MIIEFLDIFFSLQSPIDPTIGLVIEWKKFKNQRENSSTQKVPIFTEYYEDFRNESDKEAWLKYRLLMTIPTENFTNYAYQNYLAPVRHNFCNGTENVPKGMKFEEKDIKTMLKLKRCSLFSIKHSNVCKGWVRYKFRQIK